MNRALGLLVAVGFFAGCRSAINSPDGIRPARVVQVVIVDEASSMDPVTEGGTGFRVGWYYDLSPYDSLRIEFTASRVSSRTTHDHITVKLGPTLYFNDSLSVPEKSFSLFVRRSDLSKPAFSALVFFVTEPGSMILLSKLRMVGWTTI